MKTISGTFISADEVADTLRRLEAKLDELAKAKNTPSEMQVIWATQKTLAKRYDMSTSNMSRYLAPWVASGKVRRIRPSDGNREGDYRYHISDVDDCILVFHGTMGRKAG